ncbi:hypothetical protein ACN2XU_19485 [Primorskyibacter sp. 2E107]|uniref:hypothetical protein n=1 Tax=Primorskyibacter sp. 2E107 TaxID=3403458 RepID=UPI003AF451D2
MKTTEPRADAQTPAMARNTWREIVQAGADCAQVDGFALEYLIDLQRDRARFAGECR